MADPSPRLLAQSGVGICHADLAVFQQPWWLEIARGSAKYRELEVRRDGIVVGSLAFIVVTNRFGNKLGFPPIWSHLGGPVVSHDLDTQDRATVIRELISQLPANISLRFVCTSDSPDADVVRLEFKRVGFSHDTEVTYLQYPGDQGILERLSGESRRQIASAPKRVEIVDVDADEFIEFYDTNLRASGKQSYAPLRSARDLIVKGRAREAPQVRVIAARQAKGGPLDAAIAYAWDKKRYYLWMVTHRRTSGAGQSKPHPHAGKYLILDGTEDARRRGLIFDADGATTEGSQTLYRDRLKFPRAEHRDVFFRDTGMYALYKGLRLKLRAQSTKYERGK